MITFEQLLDAAGSPDMRSLDCTAFAPSDIVNVILQRSEVMRDQPRPGRIVNAWSEGDARPAQRLVDKMGDELVRRAAAVIWLEYQEIKEALRQSNPRRIADIGCGYAFFDLFAWRDFRCDLALIDLETSDERHFGYRQTGAAYSNLNTAKRFLLANGVAEGAITLCNPLVMDPREIGPVDLAVSFISCGFHYPIDTYLAFFRDNVPDGGAVIVDFRARKAKEGRAILAQLGEVSDLADAAYGNAKRCLLRKSGPRGG